MLNHTLQLILTASLTLLAPSQATESPAPEAHFPASTALAEGLSPQALEKLDALVADLVAKDEVVGGELLVIKNGKTVPHTAHGWHDRESETPLEPGSVYCVRSMTKPLIGTAIAMLIEDDVIELDDRVAEHLPEFSGTTTDEITVEQLLTHTGGMPMSFLIAKPSSELDDIRGVAALGAGCELEFAPGTGFNYSDQGTDTLTALIESVSGMTAADYVQTRILDPLGMTDSATVLDPDSALRARASSNYMGARGAWVRYWKADDEPLFPIFLGSQGLYSTAEDYAKFMHLYLKRGRLGKERLLRARAVRQALEPGEHAMRAPTGFPGAQVDYGRLMQLWTAPVESGEDGERDLVAFGHTGSDGTHAWVFPEHEALVMYFTQSRFNSTGLRVEAALAELFLGEEYDANQDAPPFEQYLGYYWEGEGDRYRTILRDGEDLALEVLGKGIVPLGYLGDDRWRMVPNPSVVLQFQRDAEGVVTGYTIGDHQEFRFDPLAHLPDVDELAERVAAAHNMARLEEVGPMRRTGRLRIEKLDMSGDVASIVAWPDRVRYDSVVGEEHERAAVNGDRVWTESSVEPLGERQGDQAKWIVEESPLAVFGDWRTHYPVREVIQDYTLDGRRVWMVRMGDTSAPALTVYVDVESDLVLGLDGFAVVPGMGRVGKRQRYPGFNEFEGMQWPTGAVIAFPNELMGAIRVTYDEPEFGVEVAEGAFELRD
jgi:CubicO group peptidase (beta-lactamase class C family)